jgi:hypothetical protein
MKSLPSWMLDYLFNLCQLSYQKYVNQMLDAITLSDSTSWVNAQAGVQQAVQTGNAIRLIAFFNSNPEGTATGHGLKLS